MELPDPNGPLPLIQRYHDPEAGRRVHRNDPDSYQLVLPYSRGRLRLERGRSVIHDGAVGPGMVRVVAPGERSAVTTHSRFESVVVRIPRPHFERVWEGEPVAAVHAARRGVDRLCPSFVSALGLRGRRRELVVDGLFHALVGLLLEEPPPAGRPRGLSDSDWDAAVTYAEERLDDRIESSRWAAALGMDVRVFSRRFAERAGATPYAWFMDRRITEAMRLLATTDLSIADTALATGFASQSHFTDAFRRRTGHAPGAWRNRSEG